MEKEMSEKKALKIFLITFSILLFVGAMGIEATMLVKNYLPAAGYGKKHGQEICNEYNLGKFKDSWFPAENNSCVCLDQNEYGKTCHCEAAVKFECSNGTVEFITYLPADGLDEDAISTIIKNAKKGFGKVLVKRWTK